MRNGGTQNTKLHFAVDLKDITRYHSGSSTKAKQTLLSLRTPASRKRERVGRGNSGSDAAGVGGRGNGVGRVALRESRRELGGEGGTWKGREARLQHFYKTDMVLGAESCWQPGDKCRVNRLRVSETRDRVSLALARKSLVFREANLG